MGVVGAQEEAISVLVYANPLFAKLLFVFTAKTLSLEFLICSLTGADKQTLKKP